MNSKALSVVASKAKSAKVRREAENILRNRMIKALRIVPEQRHLVAREKWTRGAKLASRKINNKLREIQPLLKRYRRYGAISSALRKRSAINILSVGNRRAFFNSVLNENVPRNPANIRSVLKNYYTQPYSTKKPMSNRNWAILFATNPNYRTIRSRVFR